jgi:hypothetical protein
MAQIGIGFNVLREITGVSHVICRSQAQILRT